MRGAFIDGVLRKIWSRVDLDLAGKEGRKQGRYTGSLPLSCPIGRSAAMQNQEEVTV